MKTTKGHKMLNPFIFLLIFFVAPCIVNLLTLCIYDGYHACDDSTYSKRSKFIRILSFTPVINIVMAVIFIILFVIAFCKVFLKNENN